MLLRLQPLLMYPLVLTWQQSWLELVSILQCDVLWLHRPLTAAVRETFSGT